MLQVAMNLPNLHKSNWLFGFLDTQSRVLVLEFFFNLRVRRQCFNLQRPSRAYLICGNNTLSVTRSRLSFSVLTIFDSERGSITEDNTVCVSAIARVFAVNRIPVCFCFITSSRCNSSVARPVKVIASSFNLSVGTYYRCRVSSAERRNAIPSVIRMEKIEHLIVDTAGFIDKAPLQDFGTNVYTVQDVIDEVTNRRQKTDLTVLPYTLVVETVFPENVQFVVDFSKKTGDYPNLSVTDIKVIALAYQVHKREYGADGLKTEPDAKSVVFEKPAAPAENTVGFYDPDRLCDDVSELDIDDGWITEDNIRELNNTDGDDPAERAAKVGCVTTDYAVQNVIKQIGLSIVALDGRVIKEVRTYIRRCYGCFTLTSNMTRVFCPKCGNKSLKRVAVYLDKDGKQCVYINAKRPLNLKGKKYSLPKPQGGKHAINPRLVEDQPMPHQRPSRLAKTKTNALDPDYIARSSPFATKDVYSKSAMLGFRGSSQKQWMKRNPNESNKKCKK